MLLQLTNSLVCRILQVLAEHCSRYGLSERLISCQFPYLMHVHAQDVLCRHQGRETRAKTLRPIRNTA